MRADRFDTDKNVVVLALDNKMVYGFQVLIQTLVSTSQTNIFVLVGHLEGRLSSANKAHVQMVLEWCQVDHEIVEYPLHELFTERRHLTATTFLKFVISDELRRPHLWLDIDTIVTPGWDTLFEEIARAPRGVGIVVAEKLEGPNTRFEGFNAGVLGWTSTAREQWIDALRDLPEKRFSSEQYLFNTLYSDKTSSVEASYNFLSSWHEDLDGTTLPKVIHYSGPLKPWHLHRAHTANWRGINPTWDIWFAAESEALRSLRGSSLLRSTKRHAHRALFSGRLHMGKGAGASWFLRVLAMLGWAGKPLSWALAKRAKK